MEETTAIIMPAWNEEKHLASVIKRVKEVSTKNKLNLKIIIVDDGSKDSTFNTAKKAKADFVLKHIINMGKGNAAKTGCDFAYKKGFKKIILMDSDGQHEPEDIPRFLKELKKVDLVYSYRTSEGRSPLLMSIGNFGLTWLTKILFSSNIKDTQCGFRAFNKKTYKKIRWESKLYGMETEMIVRAKGLKYSQIPIKTIYLDDYKGTTPIHGIKILVQMIRWKALKIIGAMK